VVTESVSQLSRSSSTGITFLDDFTADPISQPSLPSPISLNDIPPFSWDEYTLSDTLHFSPDNHPVRGVANYVYLEYDLDDPVTVTFCNDSDEIYIEFDPAFFEHFVPFPLPITDASYYFVVLPVTDYLAFYNDFVRYHRTDGHFGVEL
jgi:hypothetical protein